LTSSLMISPYFYSGENPIYKTKTVWHSWSYNAPGREESAIRCSTVKEVFVKSGRRGRFARACAPDTIRKRNFRPSTNLNDGQLDAALDDACADGVTGQPGGVVDVELGHEMFAMFLHGLDADAEFRGGLFVGLAFGDELQHFHLARGQFGIFLLQYARAVECFWIEPVQPPCDRGSEKGVSLLDLTDGVANVVGGGLFEQESARAGVGGVFDIGVVAVRGEHDHFGGGSVFEHLSRGFQTVEQRHGDVHQHHVGMKFFGESDRL